MTLLEDSFVPVQIDISQQGAELAEIAPGLAVWESVRRSHWKYRFGYATSVVVDGDGKRVLAASGWGRWWEYGTCANFNPDLYLAFLLTGQERHRRLTSLRAAPPGPERAAALGDLSREILDSLHAAYDAKTEKPRGEARRKRRPIYGEE
jgi:hypothetical protein